MTAAGPARRRRISPAWWIVAAIALHVAAWSGTILFAGRHPVREVPLAGGKG